MKSVIAGGIAFNTRIDGEKGAPWILLSNSLGSNLSMWEEQIEMLTRKYRVLRYDHRGHGGSEVPPGPYTWDQLTGDVVALMDAIGIERADFMGLSMGLMTGLGLGIGHGHRFGRMVLCDGRADAPEAFQRMWDGRIETIQEGGMTAMAEATIPMWLSEGFRNSNPHRTRQMRAMIEATNPDGYVACCKALQTLDYLKDAGSITNQVLFMTGSNDKGAMPDVVKGIAAAIPTAEYVELAGAHHISNVNEPDAFNAAVSEFLGIP